MPVERISNFFQKRVMNFQHVQCIQNGWAEERKQDSAEKVNYQFILSN